jgi:hypothetical protein
VAEDVLGMSGHLLSSFAWFVVVSLCCNSKFVLSGLWIIGTLVLILVFLKMLLNSITVCSGKLLVPCLLGEM